MVHIKTVAESSLEYSCTGGVRICSSACQYIHHLLTIYLEYRYWTRAKFTHVGRCVIVQSMINSTSFKALMDILAVPYHKLNSPLTSCSSRRTGASHRSHFRCIWDES